MNSYLKKKERKKNQDRTNISINDDYAKVRLKERLQQQRQVCLMFIV